MRFGILVKIFKILLQPSVFHFFDIHSLLWWSNQSILKEITAEYSLEGLMLKLKLQYIGHLM